MLKKLFYDPYQIFIAKFFFIDDLIALLSMLLVKQSFCLLILFSSLLDKKLIKRTVVYYSRSNIQLDSKNWLIKLFVYRNILSVLSFSVVWLFCIWLSLCYAFHVIHLWDVYKKKTINFMTTKKKIQDFIYHLYRNQRPLSTNNLLQLT